MRTLDIGLGWGASLLWVAGLIEGEGTFSVIRNKRKRFIYPAVSVVMTDKDVLDRLASVVGHGKIRERHSQQLRDNPHYKRQYVWTLVGSKAEHLMLQIRPWMGERRRDRIDEVLAECAKVRHEQEALAA